MKELPYQARLVSKIRDMLPGCTVIKTDPRTRQGLPDILVLYKGQYAFLEVKKSAKEPRRPNQEYYIEHFGVDAYAAFIYPENETEVLRELQRSFTAG